MNQTFTMLNELLHSTAPTLYPPKITLQEQQKISAQVNDLLFLFSRHYLGNSSKKMSANSVRYSQVAASLLLNRVHIFNGLASSSFLEEVGAGLEAFIIGLYKYYPKHFDISEPMPEPIWQRIEQECKDVIEQLNIKGLELQLQQILLQELSLASKERSPNFTQGMYWSGLGVLLKKIESKAEEVLEAVVSVLISSNFNSDYFLQYLIIGYEQRKVGEETAVQYWVDILQMVSRIAILPNQYLYKKQESCKEHLFQSISAELFAAEQLYVDAKSAVKYTTSLSVGQLAVLLHVMVDTGIIKTDNVSSLARFFGKYFKTNRTDAISETSLYKKYYQIDPASVSILRTYLNNMQQKLKTY